MSRTHDRETESGLARRTSVVSLGTLVSRLFGLARDVVIAAFVPRAATDVFFVAYAIPNALRQLLAEGTVSAVAIPVLAETRAHFGDDDARAFYRALRGIWFVALLAVTAFCVVFARPLALLFSPGFAATGQLEPLVDTIRWVSAYLMFAGSTALGMGALTTHQRFVATSFSPALVNVALITAAVASPTLLMTRGVSATTTLAIGALVGGALQMVAQWPSLARIGYLRFPTFSMKHPGVREVGRRITPLVVGMLLYFVNIAMARRLLSAFGEGAQSYFTWAFRLCAIPQGLFATAVATAFLPTLAARAAVADHHDVGKRYAFAIRLVAFVAIPVAVLLAGLSQPIVRAFFERGAFDVRATQETSRSLVALAVGIPSVAAIRQLTIVFNAYRDTRTPVLASGIHLVVFITAAMSLSSRWGHTAIPAAYSLANTIQLIVMWLLLRPLLPTLHFRSITKVAIGAAAAALVSLFPTLWVSDALSDLGRSAVWLRVVPAAVCVPIFGASYLAIMRAIRSDELEHLARLFRSRRS